MGNKPPTLPSASSVIERRIAVLSIFACFLVGSLVYPGGVPQFLFPTALIVTVALLMLVRHRPAVIACHVAALTLSHVGYALMGLQIEGEENLTYGLSLGFTALGTSLSTIILAVAVRRFASLTLGQALARTAAIAVAGALGPAWFALFAMALSLWSSINN